MFEGCVVYGEGDVWEGCWVECCVEGFCRIGHEVVVVEVGDEVVDVVLGMFLEGGDVGGGDDEGCVVGVGVEIGVGGCGVDVVDV